MKTPHKCLGINIYKIIIMIWISSLIWNDFIQYVSKAILQQQNLKKNILARNAHYRDYVTF